MSSVDARLQKVKTLIDKSVEPKVSRMVEELNASIAKLGMRVGVEVQWFIEEIKDEKKSTG